ncbi:hypothetical protein [Hymenobacter properus]|uniref:Linalool dehydratase/isomerase domain-containing protein n=1 Tax=Hymenobacter properus TaxID=2791026 RepID=A0A931FJD0_9BACT|nr:hypothetical protein [Hymenobacter properus]MBF9140385.1 hypothetical protein [Hymenobacter properus]MBR7719192.1 hypothetical protein [Microvirga sp. SRT04]
MKRKIALVIGVLVLGLWAAFSRPSYHYPAPAELRRKAHYLERIIRSPQNESAELNALGNAEWSLFSLSYAVYAFTNISQLDSTFRPEAAHYTQLAIAKMLTGSVAQAFRNSNAFVRSDSVTSVLYLGHLNLMLGCHRLLDPASPYQALHDSLSATLHRRLAAAPNHCLESYPGGVWVPDNTVALASLQLHSELTGSPYRAFCQQWVAYARQHLTDPATGLLLSKPATRHQAAQEPRGSHLGWSIFFLYRFAPGYAAEQYRRYQAQFSTNWGAIRLYSERAGSYETSEGDIDSGPLVLGYSIPANAFAFGNAVALRDWPNAQRLRRVIRFGSREVSSAEEMHYRVRFVDLPVSPLAEALILHAETMTPWRVPATVSAAAPIARQSSSWHPAAARPPGRPR